MFKNYLKDQNKKQMIKQENKTEELTLFPLDKLELVNEIINNYNKTNDYDN